MKNISVQIITFFYFFTIISDVKKKYIYIDYKFKYYYI